MLMGGKTILFSLLALMLFSGCPDYSHLRPSPDYENMTDRGGEEDAALEATED